MAGVCVFWLRRADKQEERGSNTLGSGVFQVLVSFYQMAGLVVSSTEWERLEGAAAVLTASLSITRGAAVSTHEQRGVCIWEGMTAKGKLGADAMIPALFACVMGLCSAVWGRCMRRREQHRQMSNKSLEETGTQSNAPLPSSSAEADGRGAAWLKLVMFLFVSFVEVCIRSLRCVRLPGIGNRW